MANKRRCPNCKEYNKLDEGLLIKNSLYCNLECAVSYGKKSAPKGRVKLESHRREKHRERKKDIKPLKEWQDKLQKLVNQFVVHVRDKDKPCCTCGTDSPSIKYDAGHYRTRAAAPEIRYELTNIHKQCSVKCNVHGSGMRKEYQGFIEHHYGAEHLEWLDGMHEPLKTKLPHWSDYEKEIIRYRELLRENKVKPCV
jgi:hypothetical protein